MKLLVVLLASALSLGAQDGNLTQAELAIQDAIQANDLAGASRLLDAALEHHPREGGLINLRGIVHARRNEFAEAREDFAEAVRLAPSLTPAWQNLARACQMESETDPSSVACAIDSWQHVSRAKPEDEEARGSLALLYERQRKFAAIAE